MSLKWIVPVVVVLAAAAWSMGEQTQPQGPADEVQLQAGGNLADQHQALVLHVLEQRAASVPAENADTVAAILGESEHQLEACAAALAVHQQVWQYKVCTSAVQHQGMAALNALQATAGAV
uniref:Putative secreted protein n=1 Tax=Anopheles aquasalis TaxID=42839 RepID=T1DEN6_ANOAQ